MTEKVSLIKCDKYDKDQVKLALNSGFELLGGLNKFVSKGQTVFLKLNLLMRKRPEEGVTTHPVLVESVTELLIEQGVKVIIGDSPGGPYTTGALKGIYKTAGIEEVARKTGAQLNLDTESIEVAFPEGRLVKRFTVIKPLVDADVYISMSKLKTHMMTRFTGAVKVHFGAIPGLVKAEYHFRMPEVMDFSNMLLDLCQCVNPHLNIMDGIVGMEGKGPSGGELRQVGAILVSTNSPALDVVATTLVGISPDSIPTVIAARERGLPSSLNEVEILGANLGDFQVSPFKTPPQRLNARFPIPDLINRALEKFIKPLPAFNEDQCRMCKDCINNCPPQALVTGGKVPLLDADKCISCFCCQELCPHKAVDIKRNAFSKLFFR